MQPRQKEESLRYIPKPRPNPRISQPKQKYNSTFLKQQNPDMKQRALDETQQITGGVGSWVKKQILETKW